MRSFHLLLVILSLLVLPFGSFASSVVMPQTFFTVTLPYDEALNVAKIPQGKEAQNLSLVARQAQKGMRLLLMRLTGQTRLIDSKIGQNYINTANDWLASYNIKARQEDGVTVGQDIEMNFDADRLKASFSAHHIKLWAYSQRPKTLVMGSFVQQGRLVKLNTEILDYRVDVDFRDYPKMLGLPVSIPDENTNWVYPVNPESSYTRIQEVLLSQSQQNLLSFKLLAKTQGEYELAWYLFSLSGKTLAKNIVMGSNRQALMEQMFESIMQQYVKLAAVRNIRKNHILVNVNQITFGDQVNQLEQDLKEQQPMIRKADLVTLSAGKAQFDIEYQGDLQTVLDWFKRWNKVQFLSISADKQELEVNAHYQNFKPQFQNKTEPASQSDM
ncbi:DUF2066 domain-containing protein [Thiomicrorhabdus sp. Kp2]|uniref:DUF2066 domain-containing protein n=1 Tax=Thiomicrorhabdus sp. Kp2 TaxID=1123518 RepID=UPI000405D5EC|nr:DUF2066 domain-containing protein [Thiomicrorhabdus sp. Kp2]